MKFNEILLLSNFLLAAESATRPSRRTKSVKKPEDGSSSGEVPPVHELICSDTLNFIHNGLASEVLTSAKAHDLVPTRIITTFVARDIDGGSNKDTLNTLPPNLMTFIFDQLNSSKSVYPLFSQLVEAMVNQNDINKACLRQNGIIFAKVHCQDGYTVVSRILSGSTNIAHSNVRIPNISIGEGESSQKDTGYSGQNKGGNGKLKRKESPEGETSSSKKKNTRDGSDNAESDKTQYEDKANSTPEDDEPRKKDSNGENEPEEQNTGDEE